MKSVFPCDSAAYKISGWYQIRQDRSSNWSYPLVDWRVFHSSLQICLSKYGETIYFFSILYIFVERIKCTLHNGISASYLIILPTWWGVLTEKQLNKSSWHVALLLYWFHSDAVTHHWVKKNPNKEQYTPTSVKYCDTNWNKS